MLAASATVLLAGGAAAQSPAGAGSEPAAQPLIREGAGGRVRLARWIVRTDPAGHGSALGWQRGGFSGATVSVPSVVSAAFKGAAGARNYEGSIAWYRTRFSAANAGIYALRFQSANFHASVWVDGHALGSHRGSYVPFELRSRLAAGAHTVVVRVDWRGPGEQAKEGFHRTWFNWGGLNGEVEERAISESELSGPTIQTSLSPGAPAGGAATVKVSVVVHNYGPQRTVTPEGTLAHGEQSIPVAFGALELAHGASATATTIVEVPSPALWSPSSPSLYQLTILIGSESSYSAAVGLRTLSRQGSRMYLNGHRLTLHGASIQEDALGSGDALTPAAEDVIVGELKAIGANAARAQHPLDPGLLERLDAAGILVWQGIGPVEGAGNWYSSTPRLLAEAEQQARSAAAAAQLHPSIIAWNLVDEAARNGRDSAEVRYVRSLARWLHARDPTRLVAVDVWGKHPPSHAGALYSEADAIAETDYTGWYESPHSSAQQLTAQMRRRLAAMRRTFAGKVLLISEFGAESNTLNANPSAGSYAFQARLLAAHIAVYQADPQLSGMLVWVLRDYALNPSFRGGSIHGVLPHVKLIEGLNQKGLFTYAGDAKPAVAVVRRMFAALAPS
ncbi:MAG: beta-galactosidase [Solirubrobacteraceae bacterium]|nr:beta-galactosidase [Solirubrobacteraceae bacterium]